MGDLICRWLHRHISPHYHRGVDGRLYENCLSCGHDLLARNEYPTVWPWKIRRKRKVKEPDVATQLDRQREKP